MVELFGTLREASNTKIPVNAQKLNELYSRLCAMQSMARMASEITNRQDDDEAFVFGGYHIGSLHLAIELLGKDGCCDIEDIEVGLSEANK